jgi:hypothetical protein
MTPFCPSVLVAMEAVVLVELELEEPVEMVKDLGEASLCGNPHWMLYCCTRFSTCIPLWDNAKSKLGNSLHN